MSNKEAFAFIYSMAECYLANTFEPDDDEVRRQKEALELMRDAGSYLP